VWKWNCTGKVTRPAKSLDISIFQIYALTLTLCLHRVVRQQDDTALCISVTSLRVFGNRLKTNFFDRSFSRIFVCLWSDFVVVGHFNRCCYPLNAHRVLRQCHDINNRLRLSIHRELTISSVCQCCCGRHAAVGTPYERRQNGWQHAETAGECKRRCRIVINRI